MATQTCLTLTTRNYHFSQPARGAVSAGMAPRFHPMRGCDAKSNRPALHARSDVGFVRGPLGWDRGAALASQYALLRML